MCWGREQSPLGQLGTGSHKARSSPHNTIPRREHSQGLTLSWKNLPKCEIQSMGKSKSTPLREGGLEATVRATAALTRPLPQAQVQPQHDRARGRKFHHEGHSELLPQQQVSHSLLHHPPCPGAFWSLVWGHAWAGRQGSSHPGRLSPVYPEGSFLRETGCWFRGAGTY